MPPVLTPKQPLNRYFEVFQILHFHSPAENQFSKTRHKRAEVARKKQQFKTSIIANNNLLTLELSQ
jgi:hypothetical protein